MNYNVEPPPEVQPQPPPTSPDEVVNSMDVLSIQSETNVLPEDTLMSEPSVVTSVSPEEYVIKFTSQRDRLTVIINNLQEENIQLLTTGDFSKLEANQKALSFAMNALDSAKKLLEEHNDVIATRNASQRASSINNKYIPSDKLPKFNVDPTASALYQLTHREGNKSNATNEPSLDMFLREFERKLKDHNVSIFDHWLQHLEVCFEKSDDNYHHDWFCRYLKKPVVELNQKLTWDQAKTLLKQKFDLASQTTPLMWMKHLVNFKQDSNESLTSALHRFRLFCIGAKVPLHENPMAISLFVLRLHTTKFQEIVTATVEDFNKPQASSQTTNTGDILYAPSNQPSPFNMSWDNFEAILVKKMVNLESSLLYIQENNKKQQPKTSAESSDNTIKKRKFTPSSPPLRPSSNIQFKGKSSSDTPRPYSNATYYNNNNNNRSRTPPSTSLHNNNNNSSNRKPYDFLEEMNALKRQGLCTFCKTEPYSTDHANTCSVRRKYDERKKEKADAAVSNIDNNVKDQAVGSLQISLQPNTASLKTHNVSSEISDSILLSSQDDTKDPNFSSSEDEYERLYKDFDRALLSSYENVHFECKNNANVFVIRNNNVGDINNPFNSDNVSFSPVTPITLNGINTYGIIDTGANVSVISRKFAVTNNIKFAIRSGFLILADGSKISRMQTTDFIKVEYDNVHHSIDHKFDVIDDNVVSHETKILIGTDLLPKLSIHLMNVAVKHKNTLKDTDDSVSDKAYEPNVSRAGSEKEQKVFDIAISSYVKANQNLDKHALCNISDAVLHLPTPPNYVANVKQYPIPYTIQPKVMEIINSWLDDGIIVPAKPSAWNLPMTVTFKKNLDGTKTDKIRLVLDPRMLNKELPVDNHQLPLINDIFNSMANATVFSTLDLKSAFNQFPVYEPDQVKTTFTAPNNLQYMYRGAPFGISTISQLFSRVMLTLFKDLPYVKCFVDDICVFSSSMHSHFLHVKKVLQILTNANLRINVEKTYLAKSAIYLLGYSISADGKRIDARKLTNIKEWPRPSTQKQIQSFLGFVNYFRQHTPNAASLMAPLDALRSHDDKLNGPFIWTPEHQMHFDSIRNILCSDLILSHPDLSRPFCIATDSSDYGTGCCLYQEYDIINSNGETHKVKRYIGFMSRSLTRSEKRYSVTMRELLGVIYALTQFHKFIWGTRFCLYTDHKALCYIHSQKNANSMLIKWLDVILDYTFNVVHIKGLDNILPDKLSRLYPPKDMIEHDNDINEGKRLSSFRKNHAVSNTINNKKRHRAHVRSIVSIDFAQVDSTPTTSSALHVTHPATSSVDNLDLDQSRRTLSSHDPSSELSTLTKIFYVQSDKSLYKDYFVPPDSEHPQLLIDAHNSVGHYGAEQMVKRLHNDGLHWPNLISECVQFVKKCKTCMRHNIEKKGYHPMRSIYSYLPGEHYAIDLGGPMHTTSVHNNNYFMVIVDVCTRFCILRALPDKKSDTVLRALIDVFSIMGFPMKLQSDNGTEFKNSLSRDLADAMGYDHRFITPLHASANGLSERFVQTVKKMLSKATNGVGNDWDVYLPSIQLAMNNRISKRLNSTPFSLMFARKMIEPYGFKSTDNLLNRTNDASPMSHEELMKRIDYMTDIVFPAITAKTKAQIELEQAKFNDSHKLVDYPPGSHVMVRIPTKAGQLAPVYEGPYTVVRKNEGNAYILRDETGVLTPRAYTSVELKLISNEEVIERDDEGNEIKSYEIEAIINHRGPPKNREYLVRWKNYSSEWDEWLKIDNFNDIDFVRRYWKNIGKPYVPPKNSKPTNSPSQKLKNAPPGTISTLIDTFSSDNDPSTSLANDVVSPVSISKKRSLPNSHNSISSKPTRQSKRIRRTIGNPSNDSCSAASSTRTRNKLQKSSL